MSVARLTRLVLALAGALALVVASTGLAGAQGPPEDMPQQSQAQQSQAQQSRAGEARADHAPSEQPEQAGPHATAETEDTDSNDDTPDNVVDDGDNAHPSGKDRSVEPGGSGNQGQAAHDPDDDGNGPDRSNGGLDQPDGPGGVDLADQDGNNGCGNDDDFEDDNEGLCRGRQGAPGQQPDEDVVEDIDDEDIDDDDKVLDDDTVRDQEETEDGAVLGDEERADAGGEVLPAVLTADAARAPASGTAVLGVSQSRTAAAPAGLARTGSDAAGTLIPLGICLMLLGAALEISARRRRAVVV